MSTGESLPQGWCQASVGQVALFVRGITYKKEQSSSNPARGMAPILRANNISQTLTYDDLVFVEEALISDEQRIRAGDIVFAMSSGSRKHVGKSARADKNFAGSFGAFCGLIRPSSETSDKFLAYQFAGRKFRDYIESVSKGTNINNLKQEHILAYRIALPSTAEQRRIVVKIEELFSELDEGVESLKAAKSQLKVYRQAVLKHAFEGRLSANWRTINASELEDAEALISRLLSASHPAPSRITARRARTIAASDALMPAKLPHGWACLPVGALFEVVSGNTPKGVEEVQGGSIPFYKISDMNRPGNERLMHDAALSMVEEERRHLGLALHPRGTIIFPKRGGAILTNKKRALSKSSTFDLNTMGIVNRNSMIASEYLWLWFQALDLSKIYDGSNVPQINNKNVEPLLFPVCPLEEQKVIVELASRMISTTDVLLEVIETEFQRCDGLRQSILKKAFAGQLVPQDPHDEPASVLLERIKVEKDAATNGRKRKSLNTKEAA